MAQDAGRAVSVVLPVFRGGAYFERSIASVLSQTLSDLELVIVLDGSDDADAAVAGRCQKSDRRIVLVWQDRMGIARSLNRGLGLCRSELAARQDADDESHERRLERQVTFLVRTLDARSSGRASRKSTAPAALFGSEGCQVNGPQFVPGLDTATRSATARLCSTERSWVRTYTMTMRWPLLRTSNCG